MTDEDRVQIVQTREEKRKFEFGKGGEGYIASELCCYNCGNPGHLGDVCVLANLVRLLTMSHRIAMRSLLYLTYPLSLQLSARTMSCLDLSVTRYLSPFAFAVGHESCRIKKTDLPHAMTGIWMRLLMLENKGRIETRKGWQRGLENKKMTTRGTGSIIPVT